MKKLRDLVINARSGDIKALEMLIRRFQDMAYAYAYSILGDFHLSEDVVQEAFIEMCQQIVNLRNPEAFPSWLRRIVFKHCDRFTRRKSPETVPLDMVREDATYEFRTEHVVERDELQEEVLEAVNSLPEDQRMVVTLFYIDGYLQSEIAEFLDVPVTTVQKRLYNARKRLKERMTDMLGDIFKNRALPVNFARNLLAFPFPRREPHVEVIECPGWQLNIYCFDAQTFFVPLIEWGRCDWTFYEAPDMRLTGVYECYVIDNAMSENRRVFRVWMRLTEFLPEEKEEWDEFYYLVENDTYRPIQVRRHSSGKILFTERPLPGASKDLAWGAFPMKLEVGLKWTSAGVQEEVVGVFKVSIDQRSWKCLKVVAVENSEAPNKPVSTYAEWYVAETGRTVFFRRYNGPGYGEPGAPGNFESLAGNSEIEFKGTRFRHWYDCIPDIALAVPRERSLDRVMDWHLYWRQ